MPRSLLRCYLLIASGKIALIKNETLNLKLNAWPTELEKFDYMLNYMVEDWVSNESGYSEHYQFRNLFWNQIPRLGKLSPSLFHYNQEAMLSNPKMENSVEWKRLNSEVQVVQILALSKLQQEILDLIDSELEERWKSGLWHLERILGYR